MAEEEKNDQVEGTEPETEAPAEEAPVEEAATEEAAPETEATTEEDAAPEAEEAPAEEEAPAAEEEASAEEEPAPEAQAAPDAPAEDQEPAETLTRKQLRKQRRSVHTGDVLPARDADARASERAEARATKSASRGRRRASERGKKGEPGQGTPPAERVAGTKKLQVGTVVSDKADKTITVRIEQVNRHRRYEKVIRSSSTLHAHDEANEAAAGDTVRVIESRPMSKSKRWRLVEVVEKAR